ncbi:universal stress protein [Streptomyces sp. NBC_00024]|uniref:universal stress protein n=1 Tax=Streptomyces sp. NBC_00024 TaxID=2903612 RepID=UPI00324C017C
MEPVITVGLDGSPQSVSAAHWAAREAVLRGTALRLVHACLPAAPTREGGWEQDTHREAAQRLLHAAERELRERHPRLPLTADLVTEDATTALLAAAGTSEMLVLGSRGIGAVESFFLSDIGMHVVARADRPVVLVRADVQQDQRPPDSAGVVVGVSLRGPCEEVLEFAFGAAARRGTRLRAVHGRSLPVPAYALWASSPEAAEAVAVAVGQQLGETLRPWREKFPGVRVLDEVIFDSAARAVVHAASGAGLLVVGRRRDRPALAPGIGPMAHAAIHHAVCPVAVVAHD